MQANIHWWRPKLPDGYTLNTKEYPVVISATYNEDGTLNSYTITIDGNATSTYTATYEGETKVIEKTEIGSTGIVNTKLSELPSTGGIGTYIFTIGGIVLMGAAAGFYFLSRRRKAE
ncbi:MAG: LPXTG cell wall anchor domain-containing protein [Muricomes sp.]